MKQHSNSLPLPGTQAVVRAIAVLKALGGSTSAYGITELAVATGLSKATVFRLVGALETEGMVSRDSLTGMYRLGPGLISLGAAALSTTDLRVVAHDELVRLTEESGETATLEVLVGSEVLILDEVQGRFILGSTPEIGRRWPAHATSTGKILLALADQLPTLPRLSKCAPKTIVSRAELERELERVRRNGFAICVDELEAGFVAIGAPVRNHSGAVVAALSVNGPGTRLGQKRRRTLVSAVCAAANRLSRRLGATASMLAFPKAQPHHSARSTEKH
jgi:DNA-binding IclR family transcriptional regulator